MLTAQSDGQDETPDPDLLDRAGTLGRVLMTHDDDFLVEAARRQAEGILFGGVVYAHQRNAPIGVLVEEIELIALATDESYWASRVEFLPL